MAEKKIPLKNIKVEVRPAPPVLKIVVILLIVFSMAALIALRWVHAGIRNQTEEKRQEAAALEQENTELNEKISDLGSIQSVKDIAESELGLVSPDTVIFDAE